MKFDGKTDAQAFFYFFVRDLKRDTIFYEGEVELKVLLSFYRLHLANAKMFLKCLIG